MTNARLLTLAEFAGELRLSPHTIRKWVREGKIQPVRICRRLLFDPAEVDRLIEGSRQESPDDLRRNLPI
jgi:excisionase family DNA binding protein